MLARDCFETNRYRGEAFSTPWDEQAGGYGIIAACGAVGYDWELCIEHVYFLWKFRDRGHLTRNTSDKMV